MQYQGVATIYINGREYEALKGSSLDTGGKKRNPVTGQRVYGWQAEYVPARVTCQIPNNAELSVADINALEDITITFVPDAGNTWLLANAWCEGGAQLTDAGAISVSFAANEAKEI